MVVVYSSLRVADRQDGYAGGWIWQLCLNYCCWKVSSEDGVRDLISGTSYIAKLSVILSFEGAMLAIQIISAMGLRTGDHHGNRLDFFAVVSHCGTELFSTSVCTDCAEPVWQEAVVKSIDDLRGREREHNRPAFLETLKVQVMWRNEKNAAEAIAEVRVPLSNIGPPQWYRLINPDPTFAPSGDAGLLLCALTLTEDTLGEGRIVGFMPLTEALPPSKPQHAPLYLNFQWSPVSLIGAHPLPGPLSGEILLDRHEHVEVETFAGSNSFGDQYKLICRGSLYLTDLRLMFVPIAISPSSPHRFIDIPPIEAGHCRNETELLALRRMFLQIPLGGIQDCKYHPMELNAACIRVVAKDSSAAEFVVRRKATQRRKVVGGDGAAGDVQRRLNFRSYRNGIQTEDLLPSVWCSRVVEEVTWRVREDETWMRWARCLRQTVEPFATSAAADGGDSEHSDDSSSEGTVPTETSDMDDQGRLSAGEGYSQFCRHSRMRSVAVESGQCNRKHWLAECIHPPSVVMDYHRLMVEGDSQSTPQWWLSSANVNYELCDTYPQTLVFPTALSQDDILRGAQERSRQRMPSLVWIHPITRTPLCRSAQPLAGLNKAPEGDKKVVVALQQACPSGLPLRIADARPYINAQANAIQGKGYENTHFLGGSTVAQLYFLDIQNIHVMRDSLQKLRDSYGHSQSSASGTCATGSAHGTGDATAGESTDHEASKWLSHVSTVLRGAASVAESILLGHPVLVHCSDGWDRTAQLTGLAQLMLDPYYRTVEGFLLLMEKEWMSFGHQFAHRLGRLTHKETSPVFLQYLDCVYQLLHQFPSEFEFSSGFIEVVSQCTFSGYFSSFRGNCEKSRNSELAAAVSTFMEEFDSEDLQYTSVFVYLNILLHSSIADLLLNPYYCPPDPSSRHVKYLRPRSDPSELILWQQGLMPRSMNRFAGVGGGGRGGLSVIECEALSSGTYARLLHYWNLHMPELSAASRTRIELISSKHRGRLFTISVPHQIMRRTAQHSVIPPDAQSDDGLTCFSKSVLSVEAYREQTQGRAATTIQLWYRSLSAMQRAVGAMPTNSPYSASLSKRSIREILRAILIFILRSRMHQRENVAAISYQQVSAIIEELVCNAVDYCYRRDQLAEGSMKVSISGRSPSMMAGAPGDPQKKAKKSLAEKLLKKGKKKFKKILGK